MLDVWIREGVTASEAVRQASIALQGAGIDRPGRDARLLVSAAAGLTALDLLTDPSRLLSASECAHLNAYLERRRASEPVSRILGAREFYGRSFRLTAAALDPRPDTEILIDAVLEIATEEGWRNRAVRFLDVGTGSGCLGLTLLSEMPQSSAVLSDLSPEALEVARTNAIGLGVGDRAAFVSARSLAGIAGPFDFIVSNPPYIPTRDLAHLQLDVRDYDPVLALDGGADGLDIYREICGGLAGVLPKQGWIFFEVGAAQAPDVAQIMSVAGAFPIRIWKDLGGHERCVAALTQF